MTVTLEALLECSTKELMGMLEAGHPIDPSSLDDTEYRGVSLGLPSAIESLSWKTFKKVFHRDPKSGALRGWNVRIEQTGDVHGEYAPMMRAGVPRTFGHFEVVSPDGHRAPCRNNGLLIHYGRGTNGRLDPIRRVRDPLVALTPATSEFLLGWSYLDLGFTTVGTPSFFALMRDGALSHIP